jgi:hypothetical protein
MWWFTSTTGASAHWPKQATVRTVNLRSAVVSASLSASLVSLSPGVAQPQIEADLGQQIARAARVAGRSAADADHVVALRIEVEERIKSRGAIDPGRGNAGLLGDVAQRLHRQIFMRIGGLNRTRIPSSAPGRPSCSAIVWAMNSTSSGALQNFIRTLCMNSSRLQEGHTPATHTS